MAKKDKDIKPDYRKGKPSFSHRKETEYAARQAAALKKEKEGKD